MWLIVYFLSLLQSGIYRYFFETRRPAFCTHSRRRLKVSRMALNRYAANTNRHRLSPVRKLIPMIPLSALLFAKTCYHRLSRSFFRESERLPNRYHPC